LSSLAIFRRYGSKDSLDLPDEVASKIVWVVVLFKLFDRRFQSLSGLQVKELPDMPSYQLIV
jgi:hypothetical protein